MSDKLKLIVLSGLPGAGKSTKSRELAKSKSAVVISRDDVRKFFAFLDEWELTIRMSQLARSYLRSGTSVIVDSPNLYKIDEELWIDLANEIHVQFRWVHLDTDLGECIARDSRRPTPCGEANVRQTASDNLLQLQNLAREGRELDG